MRASTQRLPVAMAAPTATEKAAPDAGDERARRPDSTPPGDRRPPEATGAGARRHGVGQLGVLRGVVIALRRLGRAVAPCAARSRPPSSGFPRGPWLRRARCPAASAGLTRTRFRTPDRDAQEPTQEYPVVVVAEVTPVEPMADGAKDEDGEHEVDAHTAVPPQLVIRLRPCGNLDRRLSLRRAASCFKLSHRRPFWRWARPLWLKAGLRSRPSPLPTNRPNPLRLPRRHRAPSSRLRAVRGSSSSSASSVFVRSAAARGDGDVERRARARPALRAVAGRASRAPRLLGRDVREPQRVHRDDGELRHERPGHSRSTSGTRWGAGTSRTSQWSSGSSGAGHRFDETSTGAGTSFVGVGLRLLAGDVDNVSFASELSFGFRKLQVSNDTGTWSATAFEFLRLGLGAEIRLTSHFTLSPMLTVSGGTFTNTSGSIGFGPNQGDGQTGTPDYVNHGQITSGNQANYASFVLGCGAHFDLFGR